MDRNINRAGWVQIKYDRAESASSVAEPGFIPEPAPIPQQPVTSVPMPQRSAVPLPEDDCGGMVLVMSYVKKQQWDETYEPEMGLERGTIFPGLDLPFVGEGECPHDE